MGFYFEEFSAYIRFEKRFSKHTLLAYHNDLSQFFQYLETTCETKEIARVNHVVIRSWIVLLVEQDIGSRSITRKISTLKSYYKYLLRTGVVTENPMLKVSAPKVSKRLPVYVEEDKMQLLFDNIAFEPGFGGLRDRLVLLLFYYTGMRLSELVQLRPGDVNSNACTVKVLGKRNKERLIPFTLSLKKEIAMYQSEKEKIEHDKNAFFVLDDGKPVYHKFVYRLVKKYLGSVTTLVKKSPHVLRHTFATHMLNHGADINAIKEILGHSNLSATQIYTHNTIDKLKIIYQQAHPKA
jgi:integrase/recombinase XerC